MGNFPATQRDRVMSQLLGRGGPVPFTIYEEKLKRSACERELRNRGLCLVRRVRSYRIVRPNVKTRAVRERGARGRELTTTYYETPCGTLRTIEEDGGFTTWTHRYPFQRPDDYKALAFLIADSVVVPDYGAVASLEGDLGGDYIVRDNLGLEPLQQLISTYMGTETFCYEWMENRDEVLKLYALLVELERAVYPVVAGGPLAFANYGGNVTPQIIGREGFVGYYRPNYEEAAETLHRSGKLIGCHLDGDNTIIMKDIAAVPFDYIEAFDAGMGPALGAAVEAWPDKTIWLNWPSAWHLDKEGRVAEKTVALLGEGRGARGLIVGITEDVPPDRLLGNCRAIMDGMERFERSNPPRI